MNDMEEKDHGDIRVADITIAHLSRGLYRSTATALKELVNNAYDADARVVRIDTNYPEFDFISCVDDGTGMSLREFRRFFADKGVGSCIKRKHGKDRTDIYKRPIIGRLGIGMLAIGQLCHSFEIESHYKENGEGKAYRAQIVLEDISIPDKEEFIHGDDEETKEVDVGKWDYDSTIAYDETRKGFRIYSADVRRSFRDEMKLSVGREEREKISFRLSELHSEFYDKSRKSTKSVRDFASYLETVWELAILCPLPYYGKIDEYPINLAAFGSREKKSKQFQQALQFIRDRQQQFLNQKFRVVFDGIELQRHIQLPTESGTIPKLHLVEFDEVVFGSALTFSGYLFAQVPRAIRPPELNGVQIRLRGVGIGGYDSTFLRYYKTIETIRSRWVSGEIFVDRGLEQALNIDRDSFNEHDEHFTKLQWVLHEKLRDVFEEASAKARELSERRREKQLAELRNSLQTMVAEVSEGRFRLVERNLEKDTRVVIVDIDKGEIVLNRASRPLKKKKANVIIQAVELAYHVANETAKNEKDRHDTFYQFLRAMMDKLV